jgi:nucleoside-diphosphate-sugar epimerase
MTALFPEYTEKMEFAIVPDITVENAFEKHLDGVSYILHLASPLANSTNKDEMFGPAVKGTMGILKDAAKVESVKKVVITSSIAALVPISGVPEGGVISGAFIKSILKTMSKCQKSNNATENTDWDLSVDTEADFNTGEPTSTAMKIYSASKLLANNASWEFYASEKPSYQLVTLHPALVYGQNLVQKSAAEIKGTTNGFLFASIMNGAFSDKLLNSVYIGDVAAAHVKSLDPKITSSKYLISGQEFTWKDVVEIAQKHFPNAPIKLAPTEPELTKTDTSKAEKELGITWATPETIITEVMKQQLGFLA